VVIAIEEKECARCEGTGFDGSTMAYEQMLADREWKEESHFEWSREEI